MLLATRSLLIALVLLAAFGCDRATETADTAEAESKPASRMHGELLIGYDLLADTLSELSQLRLLEFFKKLTLRGPVDEVSEIMDELAKASKKHAGELKKLRKLSPDVSAAPATRSPMGDAITSVAKEVGKHEMMDRDGAFDLRFVLLQAQATRMVSAIATAIARFEPNAERKKWLLAVASEYEGIRDGMIEAVRKYIAGKGAAQQK